MPSWPSDDEVDDYVWSKAVEFGIDPRVAVAVRRSESGGASYVGDHGTSFGPFQLHYGGGLGDVFTQQTKLNARDPRTWRQQVDFALKSATEGGWGPFHGAARKGIGLWDGIRGALNPGDISSGIRSGTTGIINDVYGGLVSFTQDRAAAIALLFLGIAFVLASVWSFAMSNPTVRNTVQTASSVAGAAAVVL